MKFRSLTYLGEAWDSVVSPTVHHDLNNPLVSGLEQFRDADENEFVRETALRAGTEYIIINKLELEYP